MKPYNNNRICAFKKDPNSEPVIYKPNEISAYRYLEGNYFISKEIYLDSITTTKVFLQWIIKGKINIYSYLTENTKISYFAESETDKLMELKNSEKQFYNKYHDKYSIKKQEYIGLLNYITREHTEMAPIISNSEF